MRILIAGGTGYLGTALRGRLERSGHEITTLTRHEPGPGQIRWAPGHSPLGVEVVENADVVINVTGSSLLGNPHSSAYARQLFQSRVDTTRTLADAIARSERRPALLAGNGTSWYGDHGDELVTETGDSRGDALLTRVTREWQAATEPAVDAGARVCILRTAPVFGRGSMVASVLGRLFKLGLGGRVASGRQYFPLVAIHDWVEAVAGLTTDDQTSGPVNLTIPEPTTNAEFTTTLARLLHRPAVLPVPAPAVRLAAGPMAPELLNSIRLRPEALLRSGFEFRHSTVEAVLRSCFGH